MITRVMPCLLAMSSLLAASGQQPKPTPTPNSPGTQSELRPTVEDQDVVRITTNLVQVDLVVTRDGKQVTDLKPEDFELFEDGHPQKITNFSYVSNVIAELPRPASTPAVKDKTAPVAPALAQPHDVRRTIALVVDDLGMSFESLARVRQQVRKFIDEKLQPNDLIAIVRTGGEVGSLQQFTTDRRMLDNAIEHLRWYPCSRAGLSVFAPEGSERISMDAPCGGSRNILDTLHSLKFIVQGMRELPGRKSLVLFSDYLPIETQEPGTIDNNPGNIDVNDSATGYYAELHKAAELAIRASVVIYAVDTRGLAYTGITAADRISGSTQRAMTDQLNRVVTSRSTAMIAGREGSELIARQTGGFLISNSNDFGLTRIADDQRGYYLIGYRPDDETFDRKFHHLKVKVSGRGLNVRTREGFYGISEEDARAKELAPSDQLRKALISPFGANDIRLRLTTMFTNFAETGSLLRSLIYINAQDLTFLDGPNGEHKATFDLGIVLFGDNGSVRDQQNRLVTLTLRDQIYQSALRNGLVYTLDTPLKLTGGFQFRTALRDQNSSRIGSAGQYIQLPNLQDGRLALSGLVLLKDDQLQSNSPSGDAPLTGQQTDDAISSGPAVRQFREGSRILFAYSIYNSKVDQAAQVPRLTARVRIFRDGKVVFAGETKPIDVLAQPDFKRIPNITRMQLGSDFPPGNYVLQVLVTDSLADEKQRIASQWVDFEVVN